MEMHRHREFLVERRNAGAGVERARRHPYCQVQSLLPHGRAEPAGVSQLSLNRCDKRRRLHLQLEDLSVTG